MSPNTKKWLWLFGGVGLLLLGMLLSSPTRTPLPSPVQIETIPQETGEASHRIIQGPPQFYPEKDPQESLQAEGTLPILEQ